MTIRNEQLVLTLLFMLIPCLPLKSQNIQTELVLLGTGTPNANPNRSGPALAIITGGQSYLVDFGPGVVRQAAAVSEDWGGSIEALNPKNLKVAFLTHLHSDHTAGYPDLILTPWVLERSTPLKVFGPKGLNQMTQDIIKAYSKDIDYRIEGLEPTNIDGWKVEAIEINEGIIYQDELIEVIAFKVNHGTWTDAFGYKFITKDKTIVVSGDTAPSKKLIEMSKGIDILVHEVYSQAGFNRRSEVWKKYHASHHTSTKELADIANEAQPKLLVLTHVLFWGSTEEEIIDEVQANYSGNVSLGQDLSIY
ncbi:MAG: MBL fold metallo-hydrolase [Gammaproteobacteria bacterium]|jgi:ribonuclease BN (tRNA processing enzyme)